MKQPHAGAGHKVTRLGRRGKFFKVESLPADVRRQYEGEVLADPKTTAKVAQAWLRERGFVVSFAAVTRHRARLAQETERPAAERAYAEAKRRLAAGCGLTPARLAAGAALESRHHLFEAIRAALDAVRAERRPAPPEQIAAFARAVRAQLR